MNLLTEKISKIYFKYLAAAFGSTLIISIYSLVDSFVVSMARGLVLSGLLVVILPMLLGINGVWIAIPIAEGIVSIYVCSRIAYDKEV